MRRVTFSNRSLLLGDEAADALVEYSALLAKNGSADTVTLRVFGPDADEVVATFVLAQGTMLMSQSAPSTVAEPENDEAVAQVRLKINRLKSPRPIVPQKEDERDEYGDLGLY